MVKGNRLHFVQPILVGHYSIISTNHHLYKMPVPILNLV